MAIINVERVEQDMELHVYENAAELNREAAEQMIRQINMKPDSFLGLATGGTPLGVYELLVKAFQKGKVSFRSTITMNLDEYVGLGQDHPQSYFYYMKENLFRHIDLPESQAFIPNGTADDLVQECARYDEVFRRYQPIDLQLLGLGINGHIGFNEPGKQLIGATHIVDLDDSTREANARFFESLGGVPKQALTMGIGMILKSKKILLLVSGEQKAEVLQEAFEGPITTECPASLLQTHPNVVVMADKAAAKLMRSTLIVPKHCMV